MEKKTRKVNIKSLQGVVVSDKNDKTVIVEVKRTRVHPKYQKRFTISKRYKAHDQENKLKIGDMVEIKQCRPLSKDKKWRVEKKITK